MAVKAAVKRDRKKAKANTKAKGKTKGKARSKSRSDDLEKFRELLLAERARLEEELREIGDRTSRVEDYERGSEAGSYEDLPADLASETFEREKDLALGESVEGMLQKVITALEKIDKGTYGFCDACGRPIKKARLKALPFATLCVTCQDRLER